MTYGPIQEEWNRRQKEYWLVENPWQDRFWQRVEVTEGCWLWQGTLDRDGYGMSVWGSRPNRVTMRAHIVAFRLTRGEVPEGLQLDHLCRVRHCVNPYDLEPVTNKKNQERSPFFKTFDGRSTCFRGHSLDDCYFKKDGRKVCKTCMQIARLRRLGRGDEVAAIERSS